MYARVSQYERVIRGQYGLEVATREGDFTGVVYLYVIEFVIRRYYRCTRISRRLRIRYSGNRKMVYPSRIYAYPALRARLACRCISHRYALRAGCP